VGGRATNNTRSGFVDPAGRAYAVTPAAVFRLTGERLQSSTSVYAAPNGRMIASAGMDARDNLFLLFSGEPDLYVVTGGGTGNLTLAAVPGVLVAPAELTVEPFSGDVYVTDPGNSTVCVLLGTAASFPDTIQVKSKIALPTAIVVTPSGALLVVDANTSSIVRVESGFTVPVGGVFTATPTSVTLDAAGDLFVVDGAMVVRVPGGQGSSKELVAAYFGALQAVAFDARGGTGRLFVFERARAWCVPRYNRTDGVGGASLAFQSALTKISFAPAGAPMGPALVVADVTVQAIRVIPGGATGTDSYAIPAPGTWLLLDVAMDRNGTLLAMDYKDGVYRLAANATATPESAFSVMRGSAIRIDRRDGARLFFGSSQDASVSLAPASSGPGSSVAVVVTNVSDPVGLAVDISGNIYVSDSTTHSVLRFGPAGGSGLSPAVVSYGTFGLGPWGIDVDDEENVLATDGTRLIVATRAGPRFVLGTFSNAACPAWEQGTHRICLAWASGISCFTPT
jgi:streptogramin lyase